MIINEHNFLKYKQMNSTQYVRGKKSKIKSSKQQHDANPIYRMLKYDSFYNPIITTILNKNSSSAAIRSSSCASAEKNFISRSKTEKSMVQLDLFRSHNPKMSQKNKKKRFSIAQKLSRLCDSATSVQAECIKTKKKLKIMSSFNNAVGRYCSYIPTSMDITTKQSIQANEQIIQYIKQDFFPKKPNINERVPQMLIYRQPHIKLQVQVPNLGLNNIIDNAVIQPDRRRLVRRSIKTVHRPSVSK